MFASDEPLVLGLAVPGTWGVGDVLTADVFYCYLLAIQGGPSQRHGEGYSEYGSSPTTLWAWGLGKEAGGSAVSIPANMVSLASNSK